MLGKPETFPEPNHAMASGCVPGLCFSFPSSLQRAAELHTGIQQGVPSFVPIYEKRLCMCLYLKKKMYIL